MQALFRRFTQPGFLSYRTAIAMVGLLLIAACSDKAPSTAATTPAPADANSSANANAVKPVATIQDLMAGLVMPSADVLWGATGSVSDASGVHDTGPKTDADWVKLRRSAVMLIEACNMLISEPRKVSPVELPPDASANAIGSKDIEQLLEKNRAQFTGFATALRNVGDTLLKAVDERKLDAISEAGGTMDEVCESCHKVFWYPDTAAK